MIKNSLIKKIAIEIENDFSIFEEYLLTPTKIHEFKNFLAKYRGIFDSEFKHNYEIKQSAEQTAENIIQFFINIFAKIGLAEESVENIKEILSETEKIVNLTLYYWFGLNDRNYQFRTLIHFYNIDGIGSVFLTKNKQDFAVSLSEDGIRFGVVESAHEPKCMPVSKVCELSLFNEFSDERSLIARIRTIQREICLLIDDWEHLNSILAVEYGRIYVELQQEQNKKNEEAFEEVVLKMNLRRDTLAQWCLQSFCDFQEWLTQFMSYKNLSEDIYSELDATSGVLLSGIQKIFLPASVSRHRYCDEVLPLLEKFAKSRIKLNEEDMSSHLLLQAVQSAMGHDFLLNAMDIINKRPYEWKLSFDPSSALKAFCWSYSKNHHLLLCIIYAICFFKKVLPNTLDSNLLSDIATTIQMPETFPHDHSNRVIHNKKTNINDSDKQILINTLNQYLDNNVKINKNNEELIQYIRNVISQNKVVSE